FSSRRRHTSSKRDWSSDVCSSDLPGITVELESNVYSEEAIARLHDGSLDLALVRWQTQPPGVVGRPVLIERPMVAVHADHRLAEIGRASCRAREDVSAVGVSYTSR